MTSLFANPFGMIFGALLISSPIIIHLINRMRFKRVRFAAMEFLLKSQKRSRRKLIIEQLILLLLRILLCLLAGLLLARFVGCNDTGKEGGLSTLHIILIDDTLSTSDSVRGEDGVVRDVNAEAKRLTVEQIGNALAQADSPQYVRIYRLSDLATPYPPLGAAPSRVNPTAVEEIRGHLAPFKPSLRHVALTDGLKEARAQFEGEKTMKHVLHVVGDFRNVDWSDRSKESLSTAFEELKTADVEIHLLDSVTPERTLQQKSPLANDNLAIVDFAPDARIVPKNKEVEFTVKVRNYSNSEKKGVFIRVRVNGQVREDGSVAIASVPPNGETVAKVNLASGFSRGAEDEGGEAESTPDRFNLVSAHLEGETSGIASDNVRYTVVEVRDRVPILIVDNNPRERGTKEAEGYFLWKLFTEPIKGYDVQLKNSADLDNLNLTPYASVYLCDVPRLSDAARKNVEDYVKGGGGLAFFMGPSIKSDTILEYNEKLYRKGEGVFPVPLDKLIGLEIPEDRRNAEKIRRMFTLNKKLLVPEAMQDHPALEKLYKDLKGSKIRDDEYEKFFNFVVIDRYVSVNLQQVRSGMSGLETLVYLQNTKPIDSYTKAVNDLTVKLDSAIDNTKNEKYAETLKRYRGELRRIAGSTAELHVLAEALRALLEDKGDEATKRPALIPFWAQAENAALRDEFKKLQEEVSFGDPLYVAKPYGKGRVVAFMTSAGASWNDLEGYGKPYYPPMMINMQGYLASAGTDVNLVLGSPYEFVMDKAAYEPGVKKWFYSEDPKAEAGKGKATFTALGNVNMTDDAAGLKLAVTDGKNEPGVYVYRFKEKRAEAGKVAEVGATRPDYRALSYNVDAVTEGNLARANSDDITAIAKAPLHTASDQDDAYKKALLKKKRDLSETPWLYMIILLVLIFEQAMAVRLSFHIRPVESGGTAPAMGQPALATA